MHCPRCEADTPEGMQVCIACAAPLTRRCPQCGVANLPQAKFCGQCATSLTGQTATLHPSSAPEPPLSYTPGHMAEKILTSRAALEGERKQVTVLFADLKSSMELLADRDPEDARAILDPVLERMMAAVHRYEGTVNQVMGDGIMALFGAPIALRTTPCGPAMRPWPCRTSCGRMPRRRAVAMVSACRCGLVLTPAGWWCGASTTTCTWTTRPSARRCTLRRAWNSWPCLAISC
jgi:Double zinc ribbon